MGEKFTEETANWCSTCCSLQVINWKRRLLLDGKTQVLNMGTMDFMSGSKLSNLVVSRSPLIESAEQLRYLVQYPYGCTEQIISAAFPQLYYSDLAQKKSRKTVRKQCKSNILEAITENQIATTVQWSSNAMG